MEDLDFSIDLNDGDGEREGYVLKPVSAEEGYVKDVYLAKRPEIKETKDGSSILIEVTFETKDGGRFIHRVLNPIFRNGQTEESNKKLTNSNLSKIKHIFSALTPSKFIDVVQDGKKVKVKPELNNMKFSSLRDLFEHLVKIVPEDAVRIPNTLKLVSKKGNTEFPSYPSFIANAWNGKDAKKDFNWNPDYDFLTSQKEGASKANTPDVENDDNEPNYA